MATAQSVRQRLFVDQAAARRIDDKRAGLEQRQFAGTDKVAGVFIERAVQRERVDLREQFIQWHAVGAGRAPGNCAQHHAHAKGLGQARHGTAQFAMAEQAKGFALQLDNRVVQQAELLGLLPLACGNVPLVVVQACRQVKQQHDRVLCHRRCAVALAVAHGNAVGAGGGEVDIVGAGSRYKDQLELGAGLQGFGVEGDLVTDRHLCTLQALDHVLWRGMCVQLQVAEAVAQFAEVQVPKVQGRVIKEDGAAIVRHQLYLLRQGSKA